MALTIPFVIVFVTFIIVSGLLFTSLHRSLVRETAAPEEGNNNIWEQCLHILGRAGLAVVADSHIENSSDRGSPIWGLLRLVLASRIHHAHGIALCPHLGRKNYLFAWRR